jgi:hypothetical protein
MRVEDLTEDQVADIRERLRDEVKHLAQATASWFFDGNTPEETYARVLAGIRDGDPEVLDALPTLDWSGQWADGPDWDALLSDEMPEDLEVPWEGDPDYNALGDDLFREVGQDYASEVITQSIEAICIAHEEES